MPAQKLSYKVDVDTGQAARDLARLGTAGGDAGKDIADGFQEAETASTKALKALSAELDRVEHDAKGLATAVEAIKAYLTVDVDDSKVAGFAASIESKMGVAFDEITLDAKEFADVLERGVDLSATTGEIRNVGTELDTVRDNGDQSRSVLANMAGNTAQDLGQLGGVVGSLGVGIGQLAEYAADGNVSLRGLAGVAGPMAGLAAASLVIQGISSGLADLKKRQEAYTQQQEDFNTALRESGSLQDTVNQMLEDNVQLSAAPELNWWQGMMDDLPVLTGLVDETDQAISPLVESMAAAGISAEAWAFALDHGLGPFHAMQQAIADARTDGKITEEQYDQLTTQLDLYSQTALKAEVQQAALNVVFGDGTAAASAYAKAMPTPERLAEMAAQTQAMAEAAEAAAEAIREQGDNARDAYQIMQQADWGAAKFDAATTAASAFFETADSGAHRIVDLATAYDAVAEALDAQDGRIIPDLTTPEGAATLEALDQLGQALIPSISDAFANSHGSIGKFKTDMQSIYDSTLVGLSNQLDISTDDVEALLAQIGLTPDNFETIYNMSGTEEAKLKLQLLQGQIDKLPEFVQVEIRQKIIEGDYTGALDVAQRAFARGVKVPMNFDASSADKALAGLQTKANNNPVHVPVVFTAKNSPSSPSFSKAGGYSAEPAGVGAAATAQAVPASASSGGGGVMVAPGRTVNLSVSVNAGVVGNRYDVERAVRGAITGLTRMGRL